MELDIETLRTLDRCEIYVEPAGKYCKSCKDFRLLSHFWKSSRSKDGYNTRCKDCFRNPKEQLNKCMSSGIYRSLNGSKKRRHWEDLVGFTVYELKKHLEGLFEDGMSWRNHGKNGWEIDHIIPITAFSFANVRDFHFKNCWSLENLQPLWGKDNAAKCNKIVDQKLYNKLVLFKYQGSGP